MEWVVACDEKISRQNFFSSFVSNSIGEELDWGLDKRSASWVLGGLLKILRNLFLLLNLASTCHLSATVLCRGSWDCLNLKFIDIIYGVYPL